MTEEATPAEESPDLLAPLSVKELHELRHRILHEEGFEPDVLTMKRAVQSICVARPAPEEPKPEKKKASKKTPVKQVSLDDLL